MAASSASQTIAVTEPGSETSGRFVRNLGKALGDFRGAAVLLLSVFATLSLFSFHPADVGLVWPHSDPTRNMCGPVGAFLAGMLYEYMGYGAWLFCAFLFASGASLLWKPHARDWALRAGGMALALGGVVTTLRLFEPATFTSGSVPSMGGVVGFALAGALGAWLGSAGAFLAAIFAMIAGAFCAGDAALIERGWKALRTRIQKRREAIRFDADKDLVAAVTSTEAAPDKNFLSAEEHARWRAAELAKEHEAKTSGKNVVTVEAKKPRARKRRRKASESAVVPAEVAVLDEPAEEVISAADAVVESEQPPADDCSPTPDPSEPEPQDDIPSVDDLQALLQDEDAAPAPEVDEALDEGDESPDFADADDNALEPAVYADVDILPGEGVEPDLDDPAGPRLVVEEIEESDRWTLPIAPPPLPERLKVQWRLPCTELLSHAKKANVSRLEKSFHKTADLLEETLRQLKIEASVVGWERGPVVTLFEVQLALGVPLRKVTGIADDLAMRLSCGKVRIIAPLVGRSTIGVEVPNRKKDMVSLRELLECEKFKPKKLMLPCLLGLDATGTPMIHDMAHFPHLLVAGTTGSGKSSVVNDILCSLLFTRKPEDVKLILIDPKMVELSMYEGVPHLLMPVVTEMEKAAAVLDWAVSEMERRYEVLSMLGVKHIDSFNKLSRARIREKLRQKDREELIEAIDEYMPFLVIVVDEFADLILVSEKEVEASVIRLAQKSRAVGIHVVLATQRPTVDVITGLIKANMPTRIACRVIGSRDSRNILDSTGAEKLMGQGDILMMPPGKSETMRGQAAFVSEKEITALIDFWKEQGDPQYVSPKLKPVGAGADSGGDPMDWRADALFLQAADAVVSEGRGSASLLQRLCGIGYTRASRLIDIMREEGIVGKHRGSQASEVLVGPDDWPALRTKYGG